MYLSLRACCAHFTHHKIQDRSPLYDLRLSGVVFMDTTRMQDTMNGSQVTEPQSLGTRLRFQGDGEVAGGLGAGRSSAVYA